MTVTRRAFLLALGLVGVPTAAYGRPRRKTVVVPPRLTVSEV